MCLYTTFLFRFFTSTLASKNLTLKESINIFFELTTGWVAHKDNLTVGIDKENVRHTIDTVFFISGAASSTNVVVLDSGPLLAFNVALHGSSIVVNREADKANFITPVFATLLKHLLIVSHWSLAGRTPGSPEVKQQDLSFFVLD